MNSNKAFKDIAEAMSKIDICMMQTVGEHGLNSRPMSNNGTVEYDGDNWFFSRNDSTKNQEITNDDRVNLLFSDKDTMNFISVWGKGTIVDDIAIKKKLWQPDFAQWFDAGPEDPSVTLIKVTAERIQTWGKIGEQTLDMSSL